MCVCVFRGMQKRCINERGKGGWSNKRRNVRLESADGVTVTPLTFEIIILGKSRQRRVCK